MSLLATLRHPPMPALLLVSAAGFGLSAALARNAALPGFCGSIDALALLGRDPSVVFIMPGGNLTGQLLAEWALMLLAMMPPLLALPITHLRRSSLPRRRGRAIMAFVLGYGAVWLAAALPLLLAGLGLRLLLGPLALPAALLLALGWSASPQYARAQRVAHRFPRIGLFGGQALRDALGFGALHGRDCLRTCWAWMLVPLMVDGGHLMVMLAVSILLLAERRTPAGPLGWRCPPLILRLRRGLVLWV